MRTSAPAVASNCCNLAASSCRSLYFIWLPRFGRRFLLPGFPFAKTPYKPSNGDRGQEDDYFDRPGNDLNVLFHSLSLRTPSLRSRNGVCANPAAHGISHRSLSYYDDSGRSLRRSVLGLGWAEPPYEHAGPLTGTPSLVELCVGIMIIYLRKYNVYRSRRAIFSLKHEGSDPIMKRIGLAPTLRLRQMPNLWRTTDNVAAQTPVRFGRQPKWSTRKLA